MKTLIRFAIAPPPPFYMYNFILSLEILSVSQGVTHMPPSFIQRQAQMFLLQGRF